MKTVSETPQYDIIPKSKKGRARGQVAGHPRRGRLPTTLGRYGPARTHPSESQLIEASHDQIRNTGTAQAPTSRLGK